MKGPIWQLARHVLLAVVCAGVLVTPSIAQGVNGLQAEEPRTDARVNAPVNANAGAQGDASPAAKDEAPTLHGGVNKSGYAGAAQQLASATGVSAAYDAVIEKLTAGQKLTADDYRSLHIGVYGYEMFRLYFQPEARVIKVFSGCPAAQAGIQVGDVQLVDDSANDANIVDTSRPAWSFTCGTEGQSTDVTIKRNGELLHFHLVRMNIEDIPDAKLRRKYEEMVQLTGGNGGIIQSAAPVTPSAVLRALMGL